MKDTKKRIEKMPSYLPLALFVAIAPFAIGLYNEWLSCAAALYLVGYLAYCRIKTGTVLIPKTKTALACAVLVGFFLVSPIWAQDRGMALLGFVKFMPLPLFAVAIAQISADERKKIIETIPLSGAVMTVLGAALSLIPVLSGYLLVSGRLGGFFQYPNTFAIYLLIGVAILIYGKTVNIKNIILAAVLIVGIFASGSRTVFIIMFLSLILYVLFSKNKKLKLTLLGLFFGAAAAVTVYALITSNLDVFGRYLTSSFTSSTFIGRLLYYVDALPVILKHPFGLGYMGYSFLQGSFQTGVYSVVNIHNELLQILLDVGWIPAILCVIAAVSAFKKGNALQRTVMGLLLAHSMFDFDLQFVAMGFILILAADMNNDRYAEMKNAFANSAVWFAVIAFSVYFGIANAAYYFNSYDLAAKIYPAYTMVYVQKISDADTDEEMEKIADKILGLNQSVAIAYSAKARAAFSRGEILQMIEYKKQAISLAKYSIEEYEDYNELLEIAAGLYMGAGDSKSAQYCKDCISEIPKMLDKVKAETSPLAWMIKDKPVLELGAGED